MLKHIYIEIIKFIKKFYPAIIALIILLVQLAFILNKFNLSHSSFKNISSIPLQNLLIFLFILISLLFIPLIFVVLHFFTSNIQKILDSVQLIKSSQYDLETIIKQASLATNNERKKYDIFIILPLSPLLSSPVHKLKSTEIKNFIYLNKLCMSIKSTLENNYASAGMKIYFENILIENAVSYNLDRFKALNESKTFIAIIPDKLVLSKDINEISYALSQGIPGALYYKDIKLKNDISNLFNSSNFSNITIDIFTNEKALIEKIIEDFPKLVDIYLKTKNVK